MMEAELLIYLTDGIYRSREDSERLISFLAGLAIYCLGIIDTYFRMSSWGYGLGGGGGGGCLHL